MPFENLISEEGRLKVPRSLLAYLYEQLRKLTLSTPTKAFPKIKAFLTEYYNETLEKVNPDLDKICRANGISLEKNRIRFAIGSNPTQATYYLLDFLCTVCYNVRTLANVLYEDYANENDFAYEMNIPEYALKEISHYSKSELHAKNIIKNNNVQDQVKKGQRTDARVSQLKQKSIDENPYPFDGKWYGNGRELRLVEYPPGYSEPRYRTSAKLTLKVEGKRVFVNGIMTSFDHITGNQMHKNARFIAEGEFKSETHAVLTYDVHHKKFNAYGSVTVRFMGLHESEWCLVVFRAHEDERAIISLELYKD